MFVRQTSEHEPDYEELRAASSGPPVENSGHEEEHRDTGSNKIHLQMQKLFQPPGQNSSTEAHKPPVLKRISDRRRRAEASTMERKDDHESRLFPRLYPSIRLAMREIQQIQQVTLGHVD